MVFAKIGEIGPRKGCIFPNFLVPTAPIRVARLPKIISGRIQPDSTFPIRQPINNPGMAAGEKIGRMVKASAKRT